MKDYSGGGMYGLPVTVSTFNLMFNKNIFNKFGIPYPKEGMTWDEIYEVAKKLTRMEGGTQYYGLTMSVPHMFNINQLSAPYYDPNTNKVLLEEEKFKSVVNNYARFYQLAGDKAGEMITKWQDYFRKDQTAAMMVYYASYTLENQFDFDWDVISMPYFKEAMGVAPQYTPSYMEIASSSKHKDEALEVLTYITSDEYQLMQSKKGNMTALKNPAVKNAFAQDAAALKGKNIKAYTPEKAALITPKDPLSGIAGGKAQNAFKSIVTGEMDVNTALRQAAEAARKDIETAKIK
jgi:ABC-type glycerol-3-phosphate transport system substrate-binding protein